MREKVFALLFEDIGKELPDHRFTLDRYGTYEEAETALSMAKNKGKAHDLAILDIRLSDHHHNNGLDIAAYLRKESPRTKILFHTSINSRYEFERILADFKPDGFLLKSETDYDDLSIAILTLLNGDSYHSNSFAEFIDTKQSDTGGLDSLDLKILYYLSIGISTNKIPDLLHISLSTVEIRKRKLAHHLGLERVDKQKMIFLAKKNGLI